ncbi:MAG: domain protein putative component of TonB system [Myxococcaceae bacterium]|nr:domain protein putative component of TonB system [Myxococcaceae bacterium]
MRSLTLIVIMLALCGVGCSRANVESMNAMNQGVALATQKQFVEAISALQKATVIDPQNDEAFYNMAIVHMEMRKFDPAKEDLTRAISVQPEKSAYQEKLGTVLIELKDWNGAKKALEKTVELEPGLFKAYYKLAQVDEELDDQQGALKGYTTSIEKGPSFLPAYNALGGLYADLGYLDQAVQVCQEGLKVAQPGSDDAAKIHNLLGTVYQQQKKYDEATKEFQAALRITPGMRDAVFSLGWTYAMSGNKEEAKRYLNKFLGVAGDAPEHYKKAARDKLSELSEGF